MVKMHPVMTVRMHKLPELKVLYELILTQENLNHLAAGCPELDRVCGQAPNGTIFNLFTGPFDEISKPFRPMYPDSYYIYIGWPTPKVPPHSSREEFNRLANQSYQNLEKVIRKSGRIPIQEELSFGTVTYGYVEMKIENSQATPT